MPCITDTTAADRAERKAFLEHHVGVEALLEKLLRDGQAVSEEAVLLAANEYDGLRAGYRNAIRDAWRGWYESSVLEKRVMKIVPARWRR